MTKEEFKQALEAGVKMFKVVDNLDWSINYPPLGIGDVVKYYVGPSDVFPNMISVIHKGSICPMFFRRLKPIYQIDDMFTPALKQVADFGRKLQEGLYSEGGINYQAKHDTGKPRLTLVPQQILYDIAEVREYGIKKYGDPENWRQVDKSRYADAMYRHWLAFLKDPQSVDAESGIPHYKHVACNMAFICELMEDRRVNNEKTN